MSLLFAYELDEIAAGVVEHCRGDLSHGGGLLGEPDVEGPQPLELGVDVIDRELREWDAILDQRLLEWWHCRVVSGSRRSSVPSASSGDTTVNHFASPSGTSSFFTKPSTPV